VSEVKIELFTLMTSGVNWKELRERPTLVSIREMLAIRKLEHLRTLRVFDGDAALRVKGRITELEELIKELDPEI
jgi:hypothetical protein